MKIFFKQFILCLALSLSICITIPEKTMASENISSLNHSQFSGNNIENSNVTNIKDEDVVEVFNHGQKQLYITQNDIELMAKLVYAESRGEPFEGKIAVASVVLNRVLNQGFPNSIKEVIFQPKAFSCVKNGEIVANPDQSCYDAVLEAISGKDPTNEALFFYNPAIATCSWMKSTEKRDTKSIGHHVFFKC